MELAAQVNDVATSLQQWGYLDALTALNITSGTAAESRSTSCTHYEDRLRAAVSSFKERWGEKYGLPYDDELDETTAALMARRFCNCRDVEQNMRATSGKRRWATSALSWSGDVSVGSLSWSHSQTFVRNEVRRVCGMLLEITATEERVNFRSISAPIDGPGNTLARAYLPGMPSQPNETLEQTFDTAEGGLNQETWNLVVLHEVCHSLGLAHTPNGINAKQIMDPFIQPELPGLQSQWEIPELVERYGQAGQSTEPTEPEVPTEPPPTEPTEPPSGLCPRRQRRAIRSIAMGIKELIE